MNDNDPYKSLHMVADAAILLIKEYRDGRKFYGDVDSLVLHLIKLERLIDSGRITLGDPDNPKSDNIKSFQFLVKKMDQIREDISEIGKNVSPLSDIEIMSMSQKYGYIIAEWYKNLGK